MCCEHMITCPEIPAHTVEEVNTLEYIIIDQWHRKEDARVCGREEEMGETTS